MPTIPNFPPALLEEHKHWHHANHHDPSNLPPGYGAKFLQFHRDYISRALQWYHQAGYDPRLVAPWQDVPEEIRRSPCYDIGAEMRVKYSPQSFANADELGRFIEGTNLHGCMHQVSARLYGDEDMNDFDVAPRSTIFYNIHGLIDNWYRQWERATGQREESPAAPESGTQEDSRSQQVTSRISRTGRQAPASAARKTGTGKRRHAGKSPRKGTPAASLAAASRKQPSRVKRKPAARVQIKAVGVLLVPKVKLR